MKTSIWIILCLLVLTAIIIYFVYNNKKAPTLPNVIVNKLGENKTVVINKKPGEQWTNEELKTQGYTDQQIAEGKATAFTLGTMFV